MAAMFMEDEVLVSDVSDTISKMEGALAAAEGREAAAEGQWLSEKEKEALRVNDGWDD